VALENQDASEHQRHGDLEGTERHRGHSASPSADPEAPAEERLHGGVLQRADDEARAQLQKGGGGGCRGRCARGRERAWAAQHEMEVAQAPAEGIEARWPEMAGAVVKFARLGLSRMREKGRGSKQRWEKIRPRWGGRGLDQR
jgi:hypothetical protein